MSAIRWVGPWQARLLAVFFLLAGFTKLLPDGVVRGWSTDAIAGHELFLGTLLLWKRGLVGLWLGTGTFLAFGGKLLLDLIGEDPALSSCGCFGPIEVSLGVRVALIYGGLALALSALLSVRDGPVAGVTRPQVESGGAARPLSRAR